MNIAEMCRDFIREQRQMLRENDSCALSPRTIDDYAESLETRIIPKFGHMKPRQFKSTHAAQYLYAAKQEKRPVRGNREIAALGSAFNHGMALGLVDTNPCRGVRRNRERPRSRSVSIAEVNMLLQLAGEQGGATYMVALLAVMTALTGRRRAEIRTLRRDQINEEGFSVQDSKNPDRRYLVARAPLLDRVIAESQRLRPINSPWVFPTRTGTPYTDPGFKCLWNRLMLTYKAKTGERFRAHDLRSLYVSEMLERKENPNTHANEHTMRRVYDRRRVIQVTPLA